MGITLLKKLNNCLPDSIKKLGAPFIRRQLVNTIVFLNQVEELEKADRLTKEQLKVIQLKSDLHRILEQKVSTYGRNGEQVTQTA